MGQFGSGLAIAFDGSLRYSEGGNIKSTGSGTFADVIVGTMVGLGIANGGEGSLTPSLTTGALCASTSNTLVCAEKGGGATTGFRTFTVDGSSAGLAQYFEFLTDDTAFAATSANPTMAIGGSNKFNGILWRVTPTGVDPVFPAPKKNGSYPPIVGVAVAQSSSDDATSVGTQHNVIFGPVAVDIVTPVPCTLKIKLVQLSWSEAKAKLNSVSSNQTNIYTRDPGLGGESWIDSVDVKEADDVLNNDCGLSPQTPAQVGLAQFNDPGPNKALLHCDGTDCSVTTIGNYPFFTVTDPRDSGTADDFSDFLTAQTQSDAKTIQFSTPLNNGAIVEGAINPDDPDITSHNSSGGLSIRFRICKNQACTQFENAEAANPEFPNPILSGAGLSIAAIDTNGDAVVCEITDSGSSTPLHPVFRTSDKFHNFNLNTPPGGPAICQMTNPAVTEQLFVATVFSHGGNFTKTSILFRLKN